MSDAAAMSPKFKTSPLRHQLTCLNRFGRMPAFALAAEQGTGKTWIIINNIAELWASGDVNGVLVFAPNGVHYNWDLIEIPKHMPEWVRYRVAAWSSSATKADRVRIDALFNETDASVVRIFLMNHEALQHKSGIEAAQNFAASCSKLMLVADESSAFKNPKAERTKQLLKLKRFSNWRRIMEGTLVPNGPFDAFSQYLFLDENILGTTSFYSFKNEYAEILQQGHPLLDHISGKKTRMTQAERDALEWNIDELDEAIARNGRADLIACCTGLRDAFATNDYEGVAVKNAELRGLFSPKASRAKTAVLQTMAAIDRKIAAHLAEVARSGFAKGRVPQIVERDRDGRPKYKNLDKLSALIAPFTFRVLKRDCLDLPKKVYKMAWFDLTAAQRLIYNKAEKENRLALNGEDTPFNKLVAQMKLMQITTGYYLHPDQEEPVRIDGGNPKLELLCERAKAVVAAGEKLIVWARFRIQIEDVVAALHAAEFRVVEYHGGIAKLARQTAIEDFERGDANVFVGQQQAGGRGITLVAASNVFYFSNDYALDHREQSEDRAHRIGQEREVLYTDFCARNTIDVECIEALRSKKVVSETILNAL